MAKYHEITAERWRQQSRSSTLSALEIGLHETLDIMRVNMLALETLAKEFGGGKINAKNSNHQ